MDQTTDSERSVALTPGGKRYQKVNTTWPAQLPPLTAQEAMSAAKRLYRQGMGRAFKGTIRTTSGNRYTGVRSGVLYVNPDRGWHALVHELSHLVHGRTHPAKRPHDWSHLHIERMMVEMVVSKGWLDGALRRPEKPKPDIRTVRYNRVLDRIKAWESKLRRADNALRKLNKTKAYYERELGGGG